MIILSPSLESNILIQERIKKELEFFCYYSNHAHKGDCRVELWSNLTKDKQWSAFPMTEIGNSQHYKVTVNVSHLPVGDYEFTLRFAAAAVTSKEPPCWSWYGRPGQNGIIRIVPRSIPEMTDVPVPLRLVEKHCVDHTQLFHFQTQGNPLETSFSLGSVKPSIHHYVALLRKGSSWLTPVGGKLNFDKHNHAHEKWQFLLYEDSQRGDTHLWMTVGSNNMEDCWLSPGPESTLNLNMIPCKDGKAHLLICSTTTTSEKSDFTQLFKVATDYYRASIKKEKIFPSLQPPDFDTLDVLGYCTWNAFGKSVTEDNLYQAMDSLKAHDIPVAYMIIDDGWSEVLDNRLLSMELNRDKFSCTLKGIVDNLKSRYPQLKRIGVWHALWGYWDGIHSDFKDKDPYNGFSLKNREEKEIGLVTNPEKFYDHFYKVLRHAGIDFVKVDVQGAFQDLEQSQDKSAYDLWDRYRTAMIHAADKYLESRVRHCMSLTPHVLNAEILSTKRISIFRSSDDYFPDEDDSHAWHIYANAINMLLLSQYPSVVSDWDMFESCHPFAEYHASSRAISGGPVYITDTPGKHHTELIQRLVAQTKCKRFTLLRSAQAPMPTFDTVFGNVMEHGDLICLYNTHLEDGKVNGYGVCGFWNTSTEVKLGVASSSIFRLRSLSLVPTVAYVVSGSDKGNSLLLTPSSKDQVNNSNRNASSKITVVEAAKNDAISVRVAGRSSTLVSFSHVQTLDMLSIACLGLVDKFNGTRCIKSTKIKKGTDDFAVYEAFLSHRSSQCGFWINSSTTRSLKALVIPSRITLDNQELIRGKDWHYNCETHFLCVDMTTVDLLSDHSFSSSEDFHIQIYLNLMQ